MGEHQGKQCNGHWSCPAIVGNNKREMRKVIQKRGGKEPRKRSKTREANTNLKRCMHPNVHSSITYNSQDRKTVYMYQQMNELRCCIQTQPCKRMKSHNLWPRYGTQVFLIAGRFFTIRAIREALRWTSQVLYLVKLVQQTNINTVYFHLYVESKK